MNLYIKIVNNEPYEHPMIEDNVKSCYPLIDFNNLSKDWAKFERNSMPRLDAYQIAHNTYEWHEDKVIDVWHVREMNDEEKIEKQNRVRQAWKESGSFEDWIFNEEKCLYEPPTPMPLDGENYIWNQETSQWQKIEANSSL